MSLAGLRQIGGYLEGLRTSPAAIAAMDDIMAQQRYERALQEQAARIFGQQQFQRQLQEDQIAGYRANAEATDRRRFEREDAELKVKRDVAGKNLTAIQNERTRLESEAEAASQEMSAERARRIFTQARATVMAEFGDKFSATDPAHRARIQELEAKLARDPRDGGLNYDPVLFERARRTASDYANIVRTSNALQDEAIRLGLPIENLYARSGESSGGGNRRSAERLPLPPPPSSTGSSETSGATNEPDEYAGIARKAASGLGGLASELAEGAKRESRPLMTDLKNLAAYIFGNGGESYTFPWHLLDKKAPVASPNQSFNYFTTPPPGFAPATVVAPPPTPPVSPNYNPLADPALPPTGPVIAQPAAPPATAPIFHPFAAVSGGVRGPVVVETPPPIQPRQWWNPFAAQMVPPRVDAFDPVVVRPPTELPPWQQGAFFRMY